MVPSREDNTMTLQRTMIAGVVLMMATVGSAGRAAGRLTAQDGARGAAPQTAAPAGRGTPSGMNMLPEEIPLWEGGAPGALGSADADKPTLTIYRASRRSSGTAVVIAPGGGYQNLAMDHEGRQVAAFFNSMGVSAFVLKYRLGPKYHHPIELGDAQRAIRIVRSRAQELGVLPNRIGMMGFSAGGHLASTAATHFDSGKADAPDAIERVRISRAICESRRTRRRRSSSRPTLTRPSPPRTACASTSHCAKPRCRRRCTSSRTARTVSGWRSTTRRSACGRRY
jgi:hypothetical protein